MFCNEILTNLEIWYNLKQSEIDDLEELDRLLLRKIFSTQSSCPKEALFLESGALPIGVIIKSRSVKYLHYLVKENPESMLSKFFYAQWHNEVKNDWTKQAKLDLEDLQIPEDIEYIKSKSKDSFKNLVKVKALELALNELNLVKEKHSKMQNLFYTKLELKKYLQNMAPEDAKLIFAHRVRMAQYSENFRGQAGPKLCPVCQTHLDNQQLAFTCPEISPKLKDIGKYENIFKDNVSEETIQNIRMITMIREDKLTK